VCDDVCNEQSNENIVAMSTSWQHCQAACQMLGELLFVQPLLGPSANAAAAAAAAALICLHWPSAAAAAAAAGGYQRNPAAAQNRQQPHCARHGRHHMSPD
jgi:hypothetical protein